MVTNLENFIGEDQPIFLDLNLGEAEDVDLTDATTFESRLVRIESGSETVIATYDGTRTGTTQRMTSFIPGGVVKKGKYYVQSLVTFSFDAYPIPGRPVYFVVR